MTQEIRQASQLDFIDGNRPHVPIINEEIDNTLRQFSDRYRRNFALTDGKKIFHVSPDFEGLDNYEKLEDNPERATLLEVYFSDQGDFRIIRRPPDDEN